MNLRLVSRMLGLVCLLIGGMMIFSLPWAHPALGNRGGTPVELAFEWRGFLALLGSILISGALGGWLMWMARYERGRLFRKEAMAVVGLSWVLATVLGALPFWLCGTYRSASVRHPAGAGQEEWQLFNYRTLSWRHWLSKPTVQADQQHVLEALHQAGARGLSAQQLRDATKLASAEEALHELADSDPDWRLCILFPDSHAPPDSRERNYRFRWIRMTLVDALFESQSGFSTTGATVLADLEDPELIPHCLLFWRSSTQFLGGLGIIVLFVAILGQGSAGKALVRAEMPGPSKEGVTARMQETAWAFTGIYCVLNFLLTLLLWLQGLSWFDAICHAFATMSTGGFSTWNASVGHFQSSLIDYTITLFMLIGGTNFLLIYLLVVGQPKRLFADLEFRTYLAVVVGMSALVVGFGLVSDDFPGASFVERFFSGVRYGLFQVVSVMTTTGFGTHDFDRWNSFGRGALFLLMFVGGCAGSTAGGLKVIRHALFFKIMRQEIEKSFHPNVIRPLRLGGSAIEDSDWSRNILVYFCLILVIFVLSWGFIVTVEPDSTWGSQIEHKLIDSATGIAATLNNVGPGLGTVGATQNYGHFSALTKLLFVALMMLGRLELFAILVLFMPRFWRSY